MPKLRAFTAAVLFLCLACREREHVSAPNPADALRAMRQVVAREAAVQYGFNLRVTGAQRSQVRAVRGSVILVARRRGSLRMDAIRDPLQGENVPADHYVLASDGETVTLRSEVKHGVFTSPMHRAGSLLLNSRTLKATRPFLDWEWPVANIEKARGFRNAGTTHLDGILCDVFRGSLPEDKLTVELVLGAADHLPRRLLTQSTDRANAGSTDLLLTHVHTVDRFDASNLHVETPPGYAEGEYTPGGPAVGTPAPAWTLDPGGKPLSLASLRGKIVILDFWATWCGPCRSSIPELQRIYATSRAQGVEVVGANWKDEGDAVAFAKQFGITYPHAKGDAIAAAYGVDNSGIPTMFVIDRNGRVADFFLGWSGDETARDLNDAVNRLLADDHSGADKAAFPHS